MEKPIISFCFAHDMHEVNFVKSIWSETVQIEGRPSLTSDISVEVAVIGAGMAGILTALLLKEQGIQAIVLEADRIGSGQTKNTTAKITAQHNLIYDRLIKDMGMRKARQYAQANMQAIEEYRRIIMDYNIECHFSDCPAYLYTKENPDAVRQEAEAAGSLGIDAIFTTETTLPFSIKGAVKFNNQAVFHPLEFLKAAAQDLTVFEHTKAKRLDGDKIITENASVTAKHIVFATHFPFVNVPGYYFAKMHQGRSYVLALETSAMLDGAYLGIDSDSLSLRQVGDMILLGGGGHRTGENYIGGKYQMLRSKAKEFWPQSREVACWSAQDCMTPDSVPYIGRYSRSRPNWYVCTGFGKWGMSSSMVAATLISNSIIGQRHPCSPVFSPQRHITPPAAKSIMKNGLEAAKGLGRGVFAVPKENIDNFPNGHGGIVEYGGEKYGVYKDEDGQCYIVEVRCPHMGCQLEWNPDELSWDCPCHGSRFDYRGKLIDNPAQENLACAE